MVLGDPYPVARVVPSTGAALARYAGTYALEDGDFKAEFTVGNGVLYAVGKTLLVATTHTDLEEELAPSLVITKRFYDRVDIRAYNQAIAAIDSRKLEPPAREAVGIPGGDQELDDLIYALENE